MFNDIQGMDKKIVHIFMRGTQDRTLWRTMTADLLQADSTTGRNEFVFLK